MKGLNLSVNFSKMVETPDGLNLLVVDGLNLAFRYEHKGATEFVEDYIATVSSFKKSFKCHKVVVAYDRGSSSYRKNIYPDYKIGRKQKFEAKSEAEKAQSEKFFKEFAATMQEMSTIKDFLVLGYDKVEADDIGAFIVKHRSTFGIDNIMLLSSDKDWDLLVNENVSRFSYVTRKEITYNNWNTHYDYPVDKHLFIKCLMGDSGDSVPGVEGIGPKRALALSEEFTDIYELAASIPISGKYTYIKNLNNFGTDNLMLNVKLMDLLEYCEEAIGVENIGDINNKLEKYLAI